MKLNHDQLKNIIIDEMKKQGTYDKAMKSLEASAQQKLLNEETYDEVYFRMNRLKKCTLMDAPSTILANEIRMLLEAYVKVHPKITFEIDYTQSQEEV